MSNLEQYAEQCEAERLQKRMTQDILDFNEVDWEELEDILMEIKI